MKGIILAGGTGTRLLPFTKFINKHLLPVYDKPMIYYPIECLVNAGIVDIIIVTGGNHAGAFLELLGNGKELGIRNLYYAYQKEAGGIAQALSLAEDFVEKDKSVVILGDNIIQGNINASVSNFLCQKDGAKVMLKIVDDPHRFGVAEINDNGRIISIEEKPHKPKSHYAVTGIYMYDNNVFDIVKTLKPSIREELEITDVNNNYIKNNNMTYDIIKGWWTDAGTTQSLCKANLLVMKEGANNL